MESEFCLWRVCSEGEFSYFLSSRNDVIKAYKHLKNGVDSIAVTGWIRKQDYFEEITHWKLYEPKSWIKRAEDKIRFFLRENKL